MATFIAMGGGAADDEARAEMRRRIVRQTGKDHPKALYIPTDGGEQPGDAQLFVEWFGVHGCSCKSLFLLRDHPTSAQMKEMIAEADLIFVGGGNTLRMMRMWRRFGADRALIEASKSDKVLAGVSAGAICWFEYGHSDSRSFSGKPDWPYIRVRGLGLLPGTFCPHVLGEKRLDNFKAMMDRFGGVGYGVNDGTALLVQGRTACAIGDPDGVFKVTRGQAERMRGEFSL